MKITYQDEMVYFYIGEGEKNILRQTSTDEGVIIDFDSEGNLYGVEVPFDLLPKMVQEKFTNSFSES